MTLTSDAIQTAPQRDLAERRALLRRRRRRLRRQEWLALAGVAFVVAWLSAAAMVVLIGR